jgi:murein DD-endopeptidase MepM/ murein hydrolase activator NlpD
MKQEYFVVVLAHSLKGRLRRIHVPHSAVYAILAFALLGCFSFLVSVASYARMVGKVASYNTLKKETDTIRERYRSLLSVVDQKDDQLAALQIYAKEVSLAFGIKQKLEGPADIMAEGKLGPSFAESLEDYDYLKHVKLMAIPNKTARFSSVNALPSIWPVDGRLIRSSYGQRMDPFSGEGSFHKGVDIAANAGVGVRVTADGIVVHVGYDSSGYGRLVVVDHGSGMQTYYAHLAAFRVTAGQELKRGDIVGLVGASGRVTAPHLHYEVRVGGAPVNPYFYLAKSGIYQPLPTRKDFPF